jgi:hypothetical protein
VIARIILILLVVKVSNFWYSGFHSLRTLADGKIENKTVRLIRLEIESSVPG